MYAKQLHEDEPLLTGGEAKPLSAQFWHACLTQISCECVYKSFRLYDSALQN